MRHRPAKGTPAQGESGSDVVLVALVVVLVCFVLMVGGATIGGYTANKLCSDKPEFSYDVMPCADNVVGGAALGGLVGFFAAGFLSVSIVRGSRSW
jgi:hypothetical protein